VTGGNLGIEIFRGSYKRYVTDTGGTASDPYVAAKLISVSGTNSATFSGYGDVGAYRYAVALGSALSDSYTYGDSSVSGDSGGYYLYNTFTPRTHRRRR
jgi:hypothetical protein